MPQKPRNRHRKDANNPNNIKANKKFQQHSSESTETYAIKEQQEHSTIPKISHQFYNLDPDIQQYFKQVESTIQDNPFESNNDQTTFLKNVFEELNGHEVDLATDHDGSRVLEKLLKLSDDFVLRVFFDKLCGRFAELATHRFSSHVLQTLFTLAQQNIDKEIAEKRDNILEEGDGVLRSMKQLFLAMCEELQPFLFLLISDSYGSHILRVILNILSGRPSEVLTRSKKSKTYHSKSGINELPSESASFDDYKEIPTEFKQMLVQTINNLVDSMGDLEARTYTCHPIANPVLQLLLQLMKKFNISKFEEFAGKILMDVPNTKDTEITSNQSIYIDNLLKDRVGSHLVECLLKTSPSSLFSNLYTNCFRKKLDTLATHPCTNFIVQTLISEARNPPQFELMLSELSPAIAKILDVRVFNVVTKMIESCVLHKTGFKSIVKGLCEAFDCAQADRKKHIFELILHYKLYNDFDPSAISEVPRINGAAIICALLNWPSDYNKFLVDSFLQLDIQKVCILLKSPHGMRVLETVLSSDNVSLKVKRSLLQKLAGEYVKLAKDKFGSFLFDKAWKAADIASKETIAEELLQEERILSQDYFGKIILRNCKLALFRNRRQEWFQQEQGVDKRREMFKDILDDDTTNPNLLEMKKEISSVQGKKTVFEEGEESKTTQEKRKYEDMGDIMSAIEGSKQGSKKPKKEKKRK